MGVNIVAPFHHVFVKISNSVDDRHNNLLISGQRSQHRSHRPQMNWDGSPPWSTHPNHLPRSQGYVIA
jgi:hypothetical protein